MAPPLATRAPAKINLTLHVLGRRSDGYHELESLVAFAGTGDSLSLEPGADLALAVAGPTSALAGPAGDNLVLKAAGLLAERRPGLRVGTFRLVKRLPVAAGIGGGSSDAAAALRLLARLNGLPPAHPDLWEAARGAGADVPVCLEPRARIMRGIGERLGPLLPLPPIFAVLVNPRVPVATPAVFKALCLTPGEPLGGEPHPHLDGAATPREWLAAIASGRNDLESPARRIAPLVGEAIDMLRGRNACRLARMSGSGATIFGLFEDARAATQAAKATRAARPGWWVKETRLR